MTTVWRAVRLRLWLQLPGASWQPGYGAWYRGPPPRSTSGLAITSSVLGIVGLLFCGLTSIPGAVVGHMALSRIKRTGEEGQGMAMGGLITSYITLLRLVILWILLRTWLVLGSQRRHGRGRSPRQDQSGYNRGPDAMIPRR